jgi:DNA-binding response OmpR family regulator
MVIERKVQRVLVLDDDRDFCDLLAAFLEISAGAECLTVCSLSELAHRHEDVLGCDLAILDVNLGVDQPSGIDALEWLRDHAFEGRVVFLTGHARRHPRLGLEVERSGVEVLEKPVDASTLAALVTSSR